MGGGIWKVVGGFAKTMLGGIVADVRNVHGIVVCVTDAMILKSFLPDLHVRAQFSLCPIRESAFDKLNRLFETRLRSDECVKMVRHDDEFMQKVGCASVVIQRVNQKFRPSFGVKESPAFPQQPLAHPIL